MVLSNGTENTKEYAEGGLKSVIFELSAICIGFNLYKYHLKKQKTLKIA